MKFYLNTFQFIHKKFIFNLRVHVYIREEAVLNKFIYMCKII